MDISTYLERINYRGSPSPITQTLHDLQEAHLLTVPFENLSIHLNEPIVLEDNALYDKVVNRQRGGFCYELNGLFAALLRSLGFNVTMLSASVHTSEGKYILEFDHMALLVTLGERWLVDVGFGDTFRFPLRLDDATEQLQPGGAYRFEREKESYTLMERKHGGDWEANYRFSLNPYEYGDFATMCLFHQTSPDSHFRRDRVCSRATPDGRVTLSDLKFVVTSLHGDREERLLGSEEEYINVLREQFGVYL
jgi:N-hydroxyarylamine O-acetyltransferase